MRFFVKAQMAAFPLRLLPALLLLVGLLGLLVQVEADAVADAASSQANCMGLNLLTLLIPRLKQRSIIFQQSSAQTKNS